MTSYEQFKKLLSVKKYDEALEFAEREAANGARSQQSFWMNQQVIVLMRIGKHKHAIEISEKAIALDPYNPYSLLFRSDAYLKLGNAEKALTGYEESLRNDKIADRARKGILYCLELTNNWERILSYIAQWDLPFLDSVHFKVKALSNEKRIDEATLLCDEWLRISPDNKEALWALVDLQIERDGSEVVLNQYERLAKIPSKPPIYSEIFASLCRKTGKTEKALNQYEKLEQKGQDLKISRQKAFTLAKTGHEHEAIPLLEELLRINPVDQYLHKSYIGANNRIKTLKRIVDFYHELIKIYPDEVTLFGRVKKAQKNLDIFTNENKPESPEK